MRKTVSLILLMALTVMLVASFASCKEQRSAEALMREFCSSYGIFATVYTPEASEGDEGYVGRDSSHRFTVRARSAPPTMPYCSCPTSAG